MHKISRQRILLLSLCLLGQQAFAAYAQSTNRHAIPGYVTHQQAPDNESPPVVQPMQQLPQSVNAAVGVTAVQSAGQTPPPAQSRSYSSVDFLSTTTSVIEGYSILDYRGLVEGASVRVPTWAEDSAAGSQEVYGGSIASYAQLCEEARIEAYSTMIARAKKLGANAVIGIHFDSQVMPLDKGKFATGVVCVGTAVVAKRKSIHS